MNVAVVGCGLIGRKRAFALGNNDRLVACCDSISDISEKYAAEFKCKAYTDFKKMLLMEEIDAVIVSVVNKYIKDIVIESLKNNKHVLAEKPLGRNFSESKEMNSVYVSLSNLNSLVVKKIVFKTGFNHRFHPAVSKAKIICDSGEIGRILSIRARYGHGGRPGMEKEWRASDDLCGGGELLDQGVHIIDLIRWFGGEIVEVFGKTETKFWKMNVEDNAFVMLKTNDNVTALFNVSWTEWKNLFSFEVFGADGYLKIEGLGGSYGPETLEFGKRKKEGGKPDIALFQFPSEDISWIEEWNEFKSAINEKRDVLGNHYDGLKANEIIEAIYKSSRTSEMVRL